MSQHSNQKTSAGPTGSNSKIKGSNPTYRAGVQKKSQGASSTKAAGNGEIVKPIEGQGSAPQGEDVADMPAGFGSGHYKPNA